MIVKKKKTARAKTARGTRSAAKRVTKRSVRKTSGNAKVLKRKTAEHSENGSPAYNAGYNDGFAAGFEEGHRQAYASEGES